MSTGRLPGGVRIAVCGVTREFTRGRTVHALGPIDFNVAEGEFLSIVGPSGCGKSTLLRVIAGLVAPTTGTVSVLHRDPATNLLAVVPQENSVFPWKTVEKNIRFSLDTTKTGTRAERRRVVDTWLERMDLGDFRKAYPRTLSGGMKQRVAIARALAVEPELLLMDEPFAALDAQLRTLLQEELLHIWQQDRRTVVFVTHSIEEAVLLSDRVVVCSARPGRVKESFDVPFDRPRRAEIRSTPEFTQLEQEIWEAVRDEVDLQMADKAAHQSTRRRWWRKGT